MVYIYVDWAVYYNPSATRNCEKADGDGIFSDRRYFIKYYFAWDKKFMRWIFIG